MAQRVPAWVVWMKKQRHGWSSPESYAACDRDGELSGTCYRTEP